MPPYILEHYIRSGDRRDVYLEWLRRLRDNQIKIAVMRRVNRMAQGNFGDHRFCRDGVWELRIDTGPGYRVYYALSATRVVLLLCGGDKHTQTSDIARAVACWQDWQRRPSDEKQTP